MTWELVAQWAMSGVDASKIAAASSAPHREGGSDQAGLVCQAAHLRCGLVDVVVFLFLAGLRHSNSQSSVPQMPATARLGAAIHTPADLP